MNLTLAIILGAAGAVLILVAAIGGGFTISVVSVPRVGVLPRLISFVLGGVLVFFALGWDALAMPSSPESPPPPVAAPSSGPAPTAAPADAQGRPPAEVPVASDYTPVAAPIVAPYGSTIYLFDDVSTSAGIVTDMPAGQVVNVLCTMQGESVTSEINGYTSSLWNGVSIGNTSTVGFVPDVYVDTNTTQPTMPNCKDLLNSGRFT
jgi:hypothetical protein